MRDESSYSFLGRIKNFTLTTAIKLLLQKKEKRI
jgi:hypothetical protein